MEHGADPDWVLLELEPAKAARAGLPDRIVAPRAEAEAGIEVERPVAARWGAAFAAARPEHRLAPGLAALAAAEPYRLLAQKLVADGRPADAAVALGRAIELAPYDAASRVNRASALQRADDPEAALAELEEAEWAYSNDAAFHGARGSVLESLDEPERAIVAYERALELAPGDGFLLDRLEGLGALKRLTAPDGFAYWLTPADFDRVVRAELAALFEQGAPQLVARGIALAADGHLELARLAGLLATRLDPGDESAQDLLRLGDDAEAGVDRRAADYTDR
ncbi:MAG: Tetratricopeptide repeat [Gaiellales bacterium]|nr:Tetratricopeptide repeat [Gaiellales bacterium]